MKPELTLCTTCGCMTHTKKIRVFSSWIDKWQIHNVCGKCQALKSIGSDDQ